MENLYGFIGWCLFFVGAILIVVTIGQTFPSATGIGGGTLVVFGLILVWLSDNHSRESYVKQAKFLVNVFLVLCLVAGALLGFSEWNKGETARDYCNSLDGNYQGAYDILSPDLQSNISLNDFKSSIVAIPNLNCQYIVRGNDIYISYDGGLSWEILSLTRYYLIFWKIDVLPKF